ncbi:hypothetical protein PF007_g12574 [Phytophthora fragariae]|uniref:DDE Tnp4 domain-containing protein n=1 Tax=Phytophthora fragariae TaxID=53985 RepID=A0A6A3EWG6_9STRA|nr:hypothetical protein PF009_g13398 [Phytophthora fragariae]KAE9108655.1 hypothetical protein PF007_g12574 [Phytophthora fragariae]KAE9307605.1 hypothetical protein PF001_g11549 [Phytophthora fragariae]
MHVNLTLSSDWMGNERSINAFNTSDWLCFLDAGGAPATLRVAESRGPCGPRMPVKPEGEFQKCYKMSRQSFMALAAKLESRLTVDEQQSRNRTGIEPITHINKLHMLLRWLSGGSYHDIRSKSGVSVSAFYDCIHEVVEAIIAHPDLQLQFPTTLAAQRHAASEFKKLSTSKVMKGCVGAVDGWLCPIKAPKKNEVTRVRSFFSGHYQRYGVDVQACCDHLSRFTAVTCSSPGGTGDSVAFLKWRLSAVVDTFPNGLYLVGDNAYTNTNKLLTPFPRPRIATAYHDSFNFYLSQLRIRIEMAFGLLVCKWRVFNAPLEIAFRRVPRTKLAACILHNWCINRRLIESTSYRVEEDEDLVDGLAALSIADEPPPDLSVVSQDSSRYRRLYDASDLAADTDTYNSSEWIRDAIVGVLERDTVLRPQRNRIRRSTEAQEG